jgi:VanZ family protein
VVTRFRSAGVRLWAPPALYAMAIFALSSVPNPPAPPGAMTDKHLHALVYAGLALLVLRALASADAGRVTRGRAFGAAAIAAAYGLTDELHQWFVPGRVVDAFDLLANAVGALAATLPAWAVARVRTRGAARSSAPMAEGS